MSSELTITDLENKAKNFDTPLSKVNISKKFKRNRHKCCECCGNNRCS